MEEPGQGRGAAGRARNVNWFVFSSGKAHSPRKSDRTARILLGLAEKGKRAANKFRHSLATMQLTASDDSRGGRLKIPEAPSFGQLAAKSAACKI